MLEAVLEDDEESGQKKSTSESNESRSTDANTSPGDPVEADDRKVVLKSKFGTRMPLPLTVVLTRGQWLQAYEHD